MINNMTDHKAKITKKAGQMYKMITSLHSIVKSQTANFNKILNRFKLRSRIKTHIRQIEDQQTQQTFWANKLDSMDLR